MDDSYYQQIAKYAAITDKIPRDGIHCELRDCGRRLIEVGPHGERLSNNESPTVVSTVVSFKPFSDSDMSIDLKVCEYHASMIGTGLASISAGLDLVTG